MNSIPRPVDISVKPEVTAFFDEQTNTVSYVVGADASQIFTMIVGTVGIYVVARALPGNSSVFCDGQP